jgi:uncharacterized 2Fe-2S/4Fe-4S cluster protein (DUF4445 family)
MTVCKIDFEPVGRRGECQTKDSLLECAHKLGVGISSICGGQGTCHSCKLQVLSGTVSKPTPSELETFSPKELKAGWRLACQTHPHTDVRLHLPAESMTTPQRLQVEGQERRVSPRALVRAYHLKLAIPSLEAPQADADKLLQKLNQQYRLNCDKVDISVLRLISEQLRSWKWQCQAAVRSGEVIALLPPQSRPLGLAIDLGTTKIAGYLVNLSDGQTLAAKGVMNPQISHGEDIISRISGAVHSEEERAQIQKLAAEAISQLGAELCAEAKAKLEEIVEVVVVGNTAMHHLFLGLPVRQLALAPFVPAVSRALDIKARNLNLNFAPGAYVHLLPNLAGFVGADHVAMLLATGVALKKGPIIALDIGTNTEVSLIHDGTIVSTSCASGPAFEGGHIKYGMRAAEGAIERLQISAGKVSYQTIGDAPPVGICGSGILDALAQLYLAKAIDEGGRLSADHPRVSSYRGQRQFILVSQEEQKGEPAITITQHDIRELQLAKAAIRSGIQVLLETSGVMEREIKQVIIAGAFGSYINVASAVEIGMLPSLPLARFIQAGNAAGMGAKLALISIKSRAKAQALTSKVRYIELASAPGFERTFMQASYLGRYRIINGRREAIR